MIRDMSNSTVRIILAATTAMLWCLLPGARAQEASEGKHSELPAYIEQIKLTEGGAEEPIAPSGRALFTYADSARIIADGAIWAWGADGRPVAMAKCWKNRNGSRTCAFSLTSDKLVIARGPQDKIWQPKELQVEPAELKGAPAPSPKDALRLLQIKEQSRRFTAHEFWNPENARYELRLVSQPVHRYKDDKLKIIDGAVFLLAYDNNPQILLFIEIVRPAEEEVRWQYSLARVSSADLHVLLDDKEVWVRERTPGIIGQSTDGYWHMVTLP
jgi:hypothetical protein